MSVLAQDTARGDVLIRRGVTETWGIKWEQKTTSDGEFEPVDIWEWSGVCELRSNAGDVWLSIPLASSRDGIASVTITDEALLGPEWASRPSGTWLMNITAPDGHTERLGDGYFYLEA